MRSMRPMQPMHPMRPMHLQSALTARQQCLTLVLDFATGLSERQSVQYTLHV